LGGVASVYDAFATDTRKDNLGLPTGITNWNIYSVYSQDSDWKIFCNGTEFYFDNENVYPTADATKEEVQEFLENLSKDHFDKINEFFVSIPKIKLEEEVFSPPAQKNIKLVLDNFMDFFA
jgi:hypothetical protein